MAINKAVCQPERMVGLGHLLWVFDWVKRQIFGEKSALGQSMKHIEVK